MKRIEIKINSCLQCPDLWMNPAGDAYCFNAHRIVQTSINGFSGAFVLEKMKREYIPDWCPLPDAPESEVKE